MNGHQRFWVWFWMIMLFGLVSCAALQPFQSNQTITITIQTKTQPQGGAP